MYLSRKLIPDRSITGLIPALAILTIFAITVVIFGWDIGFRVLGILIFAYAIYSFVAYTNTRSTGYLIASLYQVSMALFCWTFAGSIYNPSSRLHLIFLISFIFFGLWLAYLTINKRTKWRGREILELAATSVDEIKDGFTGRPLPAGKEDFSDKDILAFAEFVTRNMIAATYVEKDKVIFVPVMMGREFGTAVGLHQDYSQATWVAFDFDGNVAVNISREDYLTYKENLSFDQLCDSMGKLFVEFLELFRRGEGVRIIDRMDAVGLNPFS